MTILCRQTYVAVHNKTIDYLGMRWTCAVLDDANSSSDLEAESCERVSRASFFTIDKKVICDIFCKIFNLDRIYFEALYNCNRPLGRIRSFFYFNVSNYVFVFCQCAIYNSERNTIYSSVELFDINQIDAKLVPIPLMLINDPVVVAPWLKDSKLHSVLKIVI